jgi:hypothetical protein
MTVTTLSLGRLKSVGVVTKPAVESLEAMWLVAAAVNGDER